MSIPPTAVHTAMQQWMALDDECRTLSQALARARHHRDTVAKHIAWGPEKGWARVGSDHVQAYVATQSSSLSFHYVAACLTDMGVSESNRVQIVNYLKQHRTVTHPIRFRRASVRSEDDESPSS
jgi:hypothetical protein